MRTPIDPARFHRQVFSGNPPLTPYICGFVVRFREPGPFGMSRQRAATAGERAWLHDHGYVFSGGKWCRADRRTARSAQPSWDARAWRAERARRIACRIEPAEGDRASRGEIR